MLTNLSWAQTPTNGERLANAAIDEFEHMVNSIPFGSEWEIMLTGEERTWCSQTAWKFDDRVTTSAVTRFEVPSLWQPHICQVIDDIEFFFTPGGGGYGFCDFLTPKQQEEEVRRWVPVDIIYPGSIPLFQEVRFRGGGQWASARSFWRSSDGDMWEECEPCGVEKQFEFTKSVGLGESTGSFAIDGSGNYGGDEITSADSKRTCVIHHSNGMVSSEESDCPGSGDFIPALVTENWGPFALSEGTFLITKEEYPKDGYQSQRKREITLRMIRPRDPIVVVDYQKCKHCDDNNFCTRDTYSPGAGCAYKIDDSLVPPQNSPNDCKQQVCKSGSVDTIHDPSEERVPGGDYPHDCFLGTTCQCDDTETPLEDIPPDEHDCLKYICRSCNSTAIPDDSEEPLDEAPDPHDCVKLACFDGRPTDKPDKTESPLSAAEICCEGRSYEKYPASEPGKQLICVGQGWEEHIELVPISIVPP